MVHGLGASLNELLVKLLLNSAEADVWAKNIPNRLDWWIEMLQSQNDVSIIQ